MADRGKQGVMGPTDRVEILPVKYNCNTAPQLWVKYCKQFLVFLFK